MSGPFLWVTTLDGAKQIVNFAHVLRIITDSDGDTVLIFEKATELVIAEEVLVSASGNLRIRQT